MTPIHTLADACHRQPAAAILGPLATSAVEKQTEALRMPWPRPLALWAIRQPAP